MKSYVELHARSGFSFLEGASTPESLVAQAARLDIPGIALLDRDGIYGAPRLHLAAKEAGIRAHIGAEITLAEGGRLPLLVENRTGYQNLCRLITRIKMRPISDGSAKPAATREDLREFSSGLICLTGSEHGPASASRHCGYEKTLDFIQNLAATYGPRNVYCEIQRHFCREEELLNQAVMSIAAKVGLPILATNGVSYALASERKLADVLTCIAHKTDLRHAGRILSRNPERFLKNAEQMESMFRDAPQAIANGIDLSSRLQFTMEDLGYRFPEYPVPGGESMISFLRKRTEEGARNRYRPFHDKARHQIARELDLIEKLELAGYFLIVWDIVQFCREHNILVQGRGSAANSAVCFALGITAVDPVAMDLLFERFLILRREQNGRTSIWTFQAEAGARVLSSGFIRNMADRGQP